METNNYLSEFKKSRFTAILRNVDEDDLKFVFDSLKAAGVRNVEVTLNSKAYEAAFELIKRDYANDFFVGAGTVMSESEVMVAYKLGARYIISPHTDVEIIKTTKKLGLVSIPAAFTPTEIVMGRNAGADIAKLFPVMNLSAAYVNAIKQPLNDVECLVVGIPLDRIKEYKAVGVNYFAVGGKILFPDELMREKSVEKLAKHIEDYYREVLA